MPSDKTVAKARRAVRLLRTLPTPPRRTPTRARHSALHYRAHTLRDERAPGGGPGRGSTPCGITSVRPPGVHLAHSGRRLVPAANLCPRTLFRRDRAAPSTLGTARATQCSLACDWRRALRDMASRRDCRGCLPPSPSADVIPRATSREAQLLRCTHTTRTLGRRAHTRTVERLGAPTSRRLLKCAHTSSGLWLRRGRPAASDMNRPAMALRVTRCTWPQPC